MKINVLVLPNIRPNVPNCVDGHFEARTVLIYASIVAVHTRQTVDGLT